MFNVTIGKEGLKDSWQKSFPETTPCLHCRIKDRKADARIGFVIFEQSSKGGWGTMPPSNKKQKSIHGKKIKFVCDLHRNDPPKRNGERTRVGGYWLHDCCAVAVYFCTKCLNTSALYNQG